MSKGNCLIEGCEKRHLARGWCSQHYTSWRRYGDPFAEVNHRYSSPVEAFNARTQRVGDCLIWTGCISSGYGLMQAEGRRVLPHRYAWELSNGPIPTGMEVDHTCWNTTCCNVDHLRLATRFENMRNRNGAMSTSTTGVRNVRRERSRFRVIVGGVTVGATSDIATASLMAMDAREAMYGEFAGRGTRHTA